MSLVRKFGEDHINQSIRQVDSGHWIVGNLVLHRSPHRNESATWNDSFDGSSYTISETTTRPPTVPLDTPYINLVHEAGDASAVWSIGNGAFCKVRYIEAGLTPESVTLDFVRSRRPTFDIPKVLHHAFGSDRSYLFLERVPGRTLDSAWPSLDEFWRRHYVDTVVQACQEMAEWKGNELGGVDGRHIAEDFLVTPPGSGRYESVPAGCKAIGMDESNLVFYHADLNPKSLLVEDEPSSGKIGIVDFEVSGFFPRGWIRTKFRISGAMDLSSSDQPTWWRAEVQKTLGKKGFIDHVQAWMEWRGYT